jgi:hypothetical protein
MTKMSTRITNTGRQTLAVPLNSGTAIHLAPGETSDALDAVETTANAKIEKMSSAGLISLEQAELAEDEEAPEEKPSTHAAGAHPARKKPKG